MRGAYDVFGPDMMIFYPAEATMTDPIQGRGFLWFELFGGGLHIGVASALVERAAGRAGNRPGAGRSVRRPRIVHGGGRGPSQCLLANDDVDHKNFFIARTTHRLLRLEYLDLRLNPVAAIAAATTIERPRSEGDILEHSSELGHRTQHHFSTCC